MIEPVNNQQDTAATDQTAASDDAWLARPGSIKLLWIAFAVILAVCVLAQLVFKVKGYFVVDSWFGFGAVFGFLACLLMVLVAKLLGLVLKRPESYYREQEDD